MNDIIINENGVKKCIEPLNEKKASGPDKIPIKVLKQCSTELAIVQILFSYPLGSWVSLWKSETIRGSLMKPKWQKLASLAQEYAHSSFSSFVQSLLPKDTLLRTYLTSLQLVTGTVWRW